MKRATEHVVFMTALIVAVFQFGCAHFGDLTPWKGGGFGMFASTDRPDNRALSVTAVGEDGHLYRVNVARTIRSSVRALDGGFHSRTLAQPDARRKQSIAEAVLQANVVRAPADTPTVPLRLRLLGFGPQLRARVSHLRLLDLVGPRRSSSSFPLREVRVSVLKLEYKPLKRALVWREIGQPARARDTL